MKRNLLTAASSFLVVLGLCLGQTGYITPVKASNATPKPIANFNATGYPIVKDKITLKGFGALGAEHSPWKDTLTFKELEKLTNIHVEWETPPQNGYNEKRNLIIASGALPDFFLRGQFTTADEISYGTDGLFVDLTSIIDKYCSNLKERMKEDPDLTKNMYAADGKIYIFPDANGSLASRAMKGWINKTWLDRLNLKMPTTTDQLYDVLKTFKSKDANGNGDANDEFPVNDRGNGTFLRTTLGYFGLANLGANALDLYIDKDPSGKLRFYPMDDRYKAFLQYWNKLFAEGLLDNDVFTQTAAQFTAKGEKLTVGTFFQNNNNEIIGSGSVASQYTHLPVLKGPLGDRGWSFVQPTYSVLSGAITSTNKYPEATARMLDYFYSEDGSALLRLGVLGVTYHKNADGTFSLDKEIENNSKGLTKPQAIAVYAPGFAGGGFVEYIFDKHERIRMNSVAFDAMPEYEEFLPKEYPILRFTKTELNDLRGLQSDINAYVAQSRVKFVSGDMSFSQWDEFKNTLNKMGVDKLMKIYNASYERYSSKK